MMSVWNIGYNYVKQRAYEEEARDDVVEVFLRVVRCACEVGQLNKDALPLIMDSINKGDRVTAIKRLQEGMKK